jgi:hypothetical protein
MRGWAFQGLALAPWALAGRVATVVVPIYTARLSIMGTSLLRIDTEGTSKARLTTTGTTLERESIE